MDSKKLLEIINQSLEDLNKDGINITISDCETKTGFRIEIIVDDNKKLKLMENTNLRLSKKHGFTQNIVGLEFESIVNNVNKKFKIIGFIPRSKKFHIRARDNDNLTWKFTTDEVKKKLGGDKIINRNANLKKLL